MILRYCPRCGGQLAAQTAFGQTGYTCGVCGYLLFHDPKVVAVVVVLHAGQILLGRRNIEPALGAWSFPGGYVNRGEALEAAALREVKEETNLDVRLTGLLNLYSGAGNPIILVAYTADVPDISAMRPQAEEVSELAFFAPDALPPTAFASEQQIIADWRARFG